MRKCWGLCLLATSPFVWAHTLNDQLPVQYDYLTAELTSGTAKELYQAGNKDNVTALSVGVSHKWQQTDWLLVSDYAARFYHPNDETVEYYRLRFGGGYRWLLTRNLDFVTHAKIGVLRVRNESGENDTIFSRGVDIGFRYAVNSQFEVSLTGEAIRQKSHDEDVLTLRGDYYLNKIVAFGALVSYRDGDGPYVNEVGLSMKVNY